MAISLIRTIMLYIIILIAMRVMGKRQISQLQTTELVVTLLISDIAAIPMQDTSQPMASGLIPIFVLISCEVLLSFAMLKNSRFHDIVCGNPVIIINNGNIIQEHMKALRLSTEDLFEELRLNSVESLAEVKYAIIETNGMLSIVKNACDKTITPKVLGISGDKSEFEVVVISDGEFSDSSIKLCGKSRKWVKSRMDEAGIENKKNIFLMTATPSGKYSIVKKEKTK